MPISTLEPPNGDLTGFTHQILTEKVLQANGDHKKLLNSSLLSPVPTAPCCISDFIDYQIRVQPNAPAVQFQSDKAVTYAELGKLSDRISLALSIPQRSIVPICMDVSVEFIGTILAILKSGAAYLVLDPKGPKDRNKTIIESCNATTVIVDEQYDLPDQRSISLKDALLQVRTMDTGTKNLVDATASDQAYMIYTSGKSTTKSP